MQTDCTFTATLVLYHHKLYYFLDVVACNNNCNAYSLSKFVLLCIFPHCFRLLFVRLSFLYLTFSKGYSFDEWEKSFFQVCADVIIRITHQSF